MIILMVATFVGLFGEVNLEEHGIDGSTLDKHYLYGSVFFVLTSCPDKICVRGNIRNL